MDTETRDLTEMARQLQTLAEQIEDTRRVRGLAKGRWLKAYPELGTDKTYSKIVGGDLSELDVERWLDQYRHVWGQIETAPDDSGETDLYDDLLGPTQLCRAFLETAREAGNARVLLLQGESGTGKSSAIGVLRSKPYGSRVVVLEATDVWKTRGGRGSGRALLRALGRRLGVQDLPVSRDDLVEAVAEKLNGKRLCVVVDEAHHLCPEGINVIKHLVNTTPGEFVLVALPSLWSKLESSREAWVECRQITGNRLAERIVLTLEAGDVERYLQHRLETLAGYDRTVVREAAKKILLTARQCGNMAFVRDVAKRMRRAVEAGEEFGHGVFANAVAMELRSR